MTINQPDDARALTFFGDREEPDALSAIHARRPILGSGRRPADLERLANYRSFYIDSSGRRPRIAVDRIADDSNFWRVEVPITSALRGGLPGRSTRRLSAEALVQGVDPQASFTSFRPDWQDALFVPRGVPGGEPPEMKRFSGRPVRPLIVYGSDDRWVFRDATWPWGLVGRIFNNRGGSGSAVLVGPRLVVTAGHMVPWDDSPWWMRFVPAYYDGGSLHGAGVESYVSDATGYDTAGNVTGYDWAVLRLYNPLGTMLGYFGYNGYSSNWNNKPLWSIVGYPGALANAERPSFQNSITVNDTDSDAAAGLEIESETADLTPGNSGGPMFAWWNGQPRVVGVVSGYEGGIYWDWWPPHFYFDDENVMAGGTGFTNLIAWGRTNWP